MWLITAFSSMTMSASPEFCTSARKRDSVSRVSSAASRRASAEPMTSAATRTSSPSSSCHTWDAAEDVEPEVADHGGRADERHREDGAVGRTGVAERGPLAVVARADGVVGVDEDVLLVEDQVAPAGEAADGQRDAGVDEEPRPGPGRAVGADRRLAVVG